MGLEAEIEALKRQNHRLKLAMCLIIVVVVAVAGFAGVVAALRQSPGATCACNGGASSYRSSSRVRESAARSRENKVLQEEQLLPLAGSWEYGGRATVHRHVWKILRQAEPGAKQSRPAAKP